MEKSRLQTAREKKIHREILTMQRRAILSDIKIPLRPLTEVGIIYKGETFHPPGVHKTKIDNMTKKVISLMILETTLDDVISGRYKDNASLAPPVQYLFISCSFRQKNNILVGPPRGHYHLWEIIDPPLFMGGIGAPMPFSCSF